jgi:hypothetical protein
LRHAEVFEDMGHGALVYEGYPIDLSGGDFGVAVTGPRRNLMSASRLRPYFAAPFGDMMISGCFGLLAAVADCLPHLAEPIRRSLSITPRSALAPWEASESGAG